VAVVGLGAGVLVLLLLTFLQARRLARLRRRIEGLTRGSEGRSLEAVLEGHLEKVFKVERELDELAARQAVVEAGARRAFQHVGIVRFNPFEDTGGNQSFAVALLDAHSDGFVLSSLHSRVGTRVYAKVVAGGRAEATLSTEEAEALRLARNPPPERTRAAS
jgi:uncharacterized protein DUF4446